MKTIPKLAILGGEPIFKAPKSTSNLVRPNPDSFFSYIEKSFEANHMSNNGPNVLFLEERLANHHGVEFCIAVCNGLWALVLCMKALALKGKTEVIMPSLTYRRMADVAAWAGLIPHFCDIDPDSLSVTEKTIKPRINENTAIILGVHPIVKICDIDGLTDLSRQTKIPLLFDSVEASSTTHHHRMIGSFGEAECFSLHASKLINGFEGGYITTNNPDLAIKLKKMRSFGFSGQDNVEMIGLNAKMNELHAALALTGLDDLEDQIIRNKKRYETYKIGLSSIKSLKLVTYNEEERNTYKNILVKLEPNWPLTRSQTLSVLNKEGILARPYYFPLHKKETPYLTITSDLSVTEEIMDRYLLLPCGDFLDELDIKEIISILSLIEKSGADLSNILEQQIKGAA